LFVFFILDFLRVAGLVTADDGCFCLGAPDESMPTP